MSMLSLKFTLCELQTSEDINIPKFLFVTLRETNPAEPGLLHLLSGDGVGLAVTKDEDLAIYNDLIGDW